MAAEQGCGIAQDGGLGRVGCWRGDRRPFSINPPPNRAGTFRRTRLSSSPITGCKFSSEHTLRAWLSWRSRTKDAFGAVRQMGSELGERGRRNAHDHGQIYSCAPEVYRLSVHALYVYIATSYTVEQNLQPVNYFNGFW
jgi:hypothetical protein